MIIFFLSDLVIPSPAVMTINSVSLDVNTHVSTRRQYKLFVKSLGMKISFLFTTVKHISSSHLIRIPILKKQQLQQQQNTEAGFYITSLDVLEGLLSVLFWSTWRQKEGFCYCKNVSKNAEAGTKILEVIILGAAFLKTNESLSC